MGSLRLKNISKSFGSLKILKNMNIHVKDGEFIVFVGPSGCGKSTLLRVIAGLEKATSGDVEIDGRKVNHELPSKRGIAMVFQTYALYPHLTVLDNMKLGLKQARHPAKEIGRRVELAVEMLSLADYLDRRPAELSGGQRQRVAIGRAIVRKPRLFLFDEPLSNLDASLRVNTRLEIARLRRELKATMIYVTHDQTEAMTLADRIIVLNAGRIEQIGSPMELYNKPVNRFVAGFIGLPKMNFIEAERLGMTGVRTVGIRPEHVLIGKQGGKLKGVVSHIEHLGGDTNIYLDCMSMGLICARLFGERDFRVGSKQTIGFEDNHVYKFDKNDRVIY